MTPSGVLAATAPASRPLIDIGPVPSLEPPPTAVAPVATASVAGSRSEAGVSSRPTLAATAEELPPAARFAEAFGIFEGGGAKGVAHIGALKAAEDLNIKFVGAAGTSAGAIIAALVAVGYTADELITFEPAPPEHVLRRVCHAGPLSLFGRDEWFRFSGFRRASSWPRLRLIPWPPKGWLWISLLLIVPVNIVLRLWWMLWRTLACLWCILRYGTKLWRFVRQRGWFDTDTAQPFLNQLLHDRLKREPDHLPLDSSTVLFRHLPADRPLRIVATDIDTSAIKIFSNVATAGHNATPDVAVADAVAASIAVPFLFRPRMINGCRLVDGGMISNLPVWLFDEERLGRPKLPTIAFNLIGGAETADHTLFEYIGRVLRTGIFAGQSLARRGIDNLVIVPVPTALRLLDFDLGWDAVLSEYRTARTKAREVMAEALIDRPREMAAACEVIHRFLKPHAEGNLRVNIARQVSPKYLRVQFSYNMDGQADDAVFLPIARSISGEVWRERSIICRTGRELMNFASSPEADDKYLRALLWDRLNSVVSVPVFASPEAWDHPSEQRPTPIAILNIDSDVALDHLLQSPLKKETLVFFRKMTNIIARALART
jgi:NTE family protein